MYSFRLRCCSHRQFVYIADQYYELSQKKDLTDEDVAMLKFYYDYLVSHGVALK